MLPRSITGFDPTKPRGVSGGRLTLVSGTPVQTVDVPGSVTSSFLTPYIHDRIPIFNGQAFADHQYTELENDLTQSAVGNAGPAVGVANSNYDLFVWRDAGVNFLTRGPLWTSDTVRSAGTAHVRVQGTLLNAVDIGNGPDAQRGTYVGSKRTDTGGGLFWRHGGKAVGGSSGYFNIWNMYNRRVVQAHSFESSISWTYAGGILLWRAINNALNNRVSYIVGLAEEPAFAEFHCNVTGAGVPYIGIGFDTTTDSDGSSTFNAIVPSFGEIWAKVDRTVQGFHFFQAVEFNNSPAGLALFYGDIGIPAIAQNGFFFWGWF
ncbi:MAG: hypothetical protein O6952_05745 [Planctomycetota bacterium]|nr:hypothetical protein [Planctomycetota bacterium]